jgi:LPS sulfotransferase NodH
VFDAYMVCATPRTGSSLLLGLLDSSGVAGHPEAYFRDQDQATWAGEWGLGDSYEYLDFVRAAQAAGSTPNGLFGAKLMWGTLDEVVAKLGSGGSDRAVLERAFGRIAFVYLWRDDVVAQAVSRVRAEQTGVWWDGQSHAAGAVPSFDAGAITKYTEEISEHNAAWRSWFAHHGVEPRPVRYEDLDADNPGVTARVLDFLGVRAAGPIVARHRRQADDLNRDWIARYS